MSLQTSIQKKLTCLKPTATIVYSKNGEIHHEIRDEKGEIRRVKVNETAPGYVIDKTPDLTISYILPYLCLGSQDVAYDYNLLKFNKVTHILSIGVPSPEYDDIQTTFVKAYDLDEFQIRSILLTCFEVINSAKKAGGIVYVHCNAGISRSPTIVAAYLMKYINVSHTTALEMIKTTRPKIKPNPGFIKQLETIVFDYLE